MRTIKLTLCYDGTTFHGWQVQPKQRTVQETVEQAIATVTSESIRIIASGRTDAGVHALGQVVSFDTTSSMAPETLQRALNAGLPEDVQILDLRDATPGFHALRDSLKKRYRYQLQDGAEIDIFRRRWCWHHKHSLNVRAMSTAALHLLGRHDFSSFESTGAKRPDSIRTIHDIHVQRESTPHQNRLSVEVEADGFLYNMVRAIVGTLVEVGRGVQEPDWMLHVLEEKNRHIAGPTAPPQGLFLRRVDYVGYPTISACCP